jgi:hypothetical protein
VIALLLAPSVRAGDELRRPVLRAESFYESFDPRYRVVGIEDDGKANGPRRSTERPPEGRLCVERSEDNGSINLVPVRILAGRGGRFHDVLYLAGSVGECVPLALGAWSLQARSYRPYDPKATDPDECRSGILRVTVSDQELHVTVSPQSHGATYICGWQLGRQVAPSRLPAAAR